MLTWIISTAQHARPKVIHHRLPVRAHWNRSSVDVTRKPLSSISPCSELKYAGSGAVTAPPGTASLEQAGRRQGTGCKVAMDEPRPVRAHVPRLELGEVGVVAPADVVEEGHGSGR